MGPEELSGCLGEESKPGKGLEPDPSGEEGGFPSAGVGGKAGMRAAEP